MPLLFKHTEPLWGVWKTEESCEELLSRLSNEAAYLPYLNKMRTETRKREWLAARVLLKELLGKERWIAYRPSGAPFLPDTGLHISISHTKGYVAVMLSLEPNTGIDIEHIANRILKVKHKFLSEEEISHIDPRHEREHLLIHWCAKEALFKMIGRDEVDFIEHLHVHPFAYNENGRLTVSETRTDQAAMYELRYRVYADFIVTYSHCRIKPSISGACSSRL